RTMNEGIHGWAPHSLTKSRWPCHIARLSGQEKLASARAPAVLNSESAAILVRNSFFISNLDGCRSHRAPHLAQHVLQSFATAIGHRNRGRDPGLEGALACGLRSPTQTASTARIKIANRRGLVLLVDFLLGIPRHATRIARIPIVIGLTVDLVSVGR